MPEGFAKTPEPPYYAVIFTSQRKPADEGYAAMAEKMLALALEQPGCLGAESARGESGLGITVAYFADEASDPRLEAERTTPRRAAPRQGQLVFALSGAGRPGRKGLFRPAGALRRKWRND